MNKLIFRIFLVIGVIGSLYSCDDERGTEIYDPINDPTLIKYAQNSYDLAVIGEGDVTLEIPVFSSTLSSSDRTFTISVNELQTSATANQYTFNPTVIIPAGEHAGTLTVTAIESEIGDEVQLVLDLPESSEYSIDNKSVVIDLFVDCPLPDGFLTGMYELDTSIPCVNGACFGNSPVVVEVMDLGDNRRSFTANYLSQFNIGQADMTFTFTLFCGTVLVDEDQGTNLACGGNSLTIGAATMASTFDDTDDSSIEINFTDDSISSCGGAAQSAIILTKI